MFSFIVVCACVLFQRRGHKGRVRKICHVITLLAPNETLYFKEQYTLPGVGVMQHSKQTAGLNPKRAREKVSYFFPLRPLFCTYQNKVISRSESPYYKPYKKRATHIIDLWQSV